MIDICALPHDNIPARVPFSLHLGPQCGCGGSLGKLHNFRSCRQQGLASTPRNYMPLHCYCVNQWTTSYAITDNMIFTWSWCRVFTLWILISKLYMCLTRKSLLAQQRSQGRGAEFMARVLSFPWDQFVLVDETGSDAQNFARKFGYSLRGMKAEVPSLLVREQRITATPYK